MGEQSPLWLNRHCILNTRPAHQAGGLQNLLTAQGARVIGFPSIEIVDVEPGDVHTGLRDDISDYDIAIFVSRNAVDGAFRFLSGVSLPGKLQLAVIGEGTYQALQSLVPDLDQRLIRSEPYNSEGLLQARALLQANGKKVIIFRGQQGRTLLADELSSRGATVTQLEVYRRQAPEYVEKDFSECVANEFPTLVLLTSTEGMLNLLPLVDHHSREKLLRTPWLLISERMRESAVNLGHNAEILIATKASDDGIAQTIIDWAKQT